MSDYLSHIAAKALNLVPVIEPRPTSLFEPTPGLRVSSDNLLTDRVIDEAPDVAALGSVPAADLHPLQGQSFARPPTYDPSRPADITPPMAAPTVSVARTQAVWSTPQTAASATAEPTPEPSADAVTSDMTSAATPVATAPSPGHIPGPPARDRPKQFAANPSLPTLEAANPPMSFAPPTSSSPSAPSSPRGDALSARVHPLDAEEHRSEPLNTTAGKIVVQALVTPASASSVRAAGESTMAQTSQPTIRVSIGRVEVRAIMPPAPTPPRPKAARPGAKPSLAEYLKSSQRGQR